MIYMRPQPKHPSPTHAPGLHTLELPLIAAGIVDNEAPAHFPTRRGEEIDAAADRDQRRMRVRRQRRLGRATEEEGGEGGMVVGGEGGGEAGIREDGVLVEIAVFVFRLASAAIVCVGVGEGVDEGEIEPHQVAAGFVVVFEGGAGVGPEAGVEVEEVTVVEERVRPKPVARYAGPVVWEGRVARDEVGE